MAQLAVEPLWRRVSLDQDLGSQGGQGAQLYWIWLNFDQTQSPILVSLTTRDTIWRCLTASLIKSMTFWRLIEAEEVVKTPRKAREFSHPTLRVVDLFQLNQRKDIVERQTKCVLHSKPQTSPSWWHRNVSGSPRSLGYILWEPWMYIWNFMAIHHAAVVIL